MKQQKLNKAVDFFLWIVISISIIIVCTYLYVWGGSLSKKAEDWSMFATLISGISLMLFSVVNLKIWLYQTQISNETVIRQVKITEQFNRLKALEERVLFVSKGHDSYEEIEKNAEKAYNELLNWRLGIHESVFKNDIELINKASFSIFNVQILWMKHNKGKALLSSNKDRYSEEHLNDLKENQTPVKDLLEFYRDQIY